MAEILHTYDPAAVRQGERVVAAYEIYLKSAHALSKLVIEKYFGDEAKAKTDPAFPALFNQKDKDWKVWQREASRHGKMFVGMDR